MSGASERNVINVLRSIPRTEMTQEKQESIVRELKRITVHEPPSPIHSVFRPRKPNRWIRSVGATLGAAGVAVIVVLGAAFQVIDHHGKTVPTPQRSNPKPTSAVSQQWQKKLGFQPLRPTYLPAGVIQQKATTGIGTNSVTGQNSHTYSIFYGYQDVSQYQTTGSGKNKTRIAPLSLTEVPVTQDSTTLKNFPPLHDVTINGAQFMEPVQRNSSQKQTLETSGNILFRKHNGLLLMVSGTESKSVLAKVLLSLVPVTAPPNEVDKSAMGTHADTTTFKIILPTDLPHGFKEDLSENTNSGEYVSQGSTSSSYDTAYVGPGGRIGIEEYYTKGTKNPVKMEKNSTPIRIHGQTVHLVQSHTYVNDQTMAPYYRFEWIDPKTKVHFWVDGQSTTTGEIMTKSLMEKVVSSMIEQSAK